MAGEESTGRLEATFEISLSPLQRGLKQASSLMAAWAKKHDEDPEGSVGLDLGPLQRGLRRADGMLQSFDGKEATANLRVNLTGLQQGLREGSRRLSEFDGKKAEARVTADTSSATRSFNSLRRQLSDLSRESGNLTVDADTTKARDAIRQLVQWAGKQSASVATGADTSDARQTVASLVRSINSRSASVTVGAKTQDARREVERFIKWVREQRAEITISAATGDAQLAAESVRAYINSLFAKIHVGASTGTAMSEARRAAGRINSMSPEFDVGAETTGAMGEVQGIVSRVNGMRGDFNVGANTSPARAELAGFNQTVQRYSRAWGSQGIRVQVQSDITQAAAQLRNLERIARSVTDPEYKVRVDAQVARARGQLNALGTISDGLGMKRPTISVGMRGVAASTAQMLGLYALADRLDGYNIKIGASVDDNLSRAIPAMLGDLGQQLARFRSIATTVAAVTVPAFYTALSTLPAVISMAATAAGAFATRLGAGVVGAMGSVGSAAILGGGALGVYGMALRKTAQYAFNLGSMLKDQERKVADAKDAVKLATAAVAAATPGTQKHALAVKGLALAEQAAEYETKKFSAILEATTPQMMKMNKEAGNLHIEFIRLGGAVANKTAPIMTKWIQGLTKLLPTVRPHILEMVGDMNKVSGSFVKTMSKGRELKNLTTIMSGIKSAGVPALTTLTNVARMFVNVFAAMVPAGLKVLNVMARATTAAAKWTGSAEGQKRIGVVWNALATAGAQLWRIIRDLSIGMAGVVVALNATGIGQGMMAGLEGIASGFRKASGEGGKVRRVVTEMGEYAKPVLAAIADLVKGVATQFGLMAMEVGKSGLLVDIVNAFNDALLGTKDGQGIIKMLRHEFKEIGPLLPPLITALGNWFSTFAQSEPEMILFIKTFTKILEAFNSLPEPIKRGIARTIAWGSALNALGANQLPGVIAQVYFLNKANKVANAAMLAMGGQATTQVGILGRMKLAVTAAATRIQIMTVAVWKYIASSRVAALSMRAMGVAATFMLGPWGLVIIAVAALGAALVIAYRRSETFRNAVNALGNFLKGTAIAAFQGLVSAARSVWQWFQKLPAPIQALISPIGALVANFGRIRGAVGNAAVAVGQFVAKLAAEAVRIFGNVLNFLWNAVKPVVMWIGKAAVAVGNFVAKLVGQRVRQYGADLGFLWNAVKPVVQWLGRAAVAVGNFVAKLAGGTVRVFGNVLNFLWNAVKPVVQWLGRAALAVGVFVAKLVGQRVRQYAAVLGFLWNAVKPVVQWLGRAAVAVGVFVAKLAGQRVRQFGAVLSFLWNAVKPVVQWLGRAAAAVGRFIAKLVVAGVKVFGRVLGFLWNAIKPVVAWLGKAAVAVGRFITKTSGVAGVKVFGRVLGFLWNAAKPVVIWLGKAALAVGKFVAKLAVGTVRTYVRVLGAVWNAIKPVVVWLGKAALAVGKFVAKLAIGTIRTYVRVLGTIWNAVKPVVLWLGKAAVAVGKFLAKLVVKGIKLFVAGIKTIWNGAKTLIRWIGDAARAVGRFATSVFNGAKNMRQTWDKFWSWAENLFKRGVRSIQFTLIKWRMQAERLFKLFVLGMQKLWNGFWSFLKNLWDRSLKAIGNRVDSWTKAVRSLFTSLSRWAQTRWKSFWADLNRMWDKALGTIGNRTEKWRTALRNLMDAIAKAVRKRWNDFWSGLKGLWDRSFTAIGNRTGKWRDALRNLMDSIAKAVRQRWNDFWSGLKGLWDRSFTAVGNRTEKWRDALRNLMDAIAKAVRSRWDDFWSGLKGLWDRSFTAVGNRTEKWRDALRNLMDSIAKNVRGRWDDFWSGLKGLWDRSLTSIGDRLRSWGTATKKLFGDIVGAAKKFGDNLKKALVSRISSAVNKVRDWLGWLATALGKVLGALGMDKAAGNMHARAKKLKKPHKFAKGGTTEEYATGGLGTSAKAPRMHLWNEQHGNEAYIVEKRPTKEQMPNLQTAASWHDSVVVPKDGRISPDAPPRMLPKKDQHGKNDVPFARGGVTGAEIPVRKFAYGLRGWDGGAARMVKAVEGKFGAKAPASTYTNHAGGGQRGAADFLVSGRYGRAARGSQVTTGNNVSSYIADNWKKFAMHQIIWNNRITTGGPGGWRKWGPKPKVQGRHEDHVHGGANTSGGASYTGSAPGGGGFSGVKDFLGRAYNSVKDFVAKRFKPPKLPKLGLGSFGASLTGGLKDTVLGGARKYVTRLAREHLSMGDGGGGGGKAAPAGKVKEWIKSGFGMGGAFPASSGNVNAMYSRVMQESGGNPRAVNNWDSNAKKGTPSKGLVQIIEPTWNANTTKKIGKFDSNWSDPVKSVAVSSRYMKKQYGRVVGSNGRGYDTGGVIPGFTGEPKLLLAHAGERVLPKDLNRGFESLARSISLWDARNGSNPSVDIGERSEDVRRQNELLEENNELLRRIYREHPDAIGGRVKAGTDHNLEHDRKTQAAARSGVEARQRTGRITQGRA